MVTVIVISTEELGDRSYIAHDGTVAIVVDPQRDIDRVEEALGQANLRLEAVLETHVHNDYVSGGLELARRTGARYVLAAGDRLAFAHEEVRDGDRLAAGAMTIEVVATPGHTDSHVAYVIGDESGANAVFSGGSLLYGSVGRTDLVDSERVDELTRAQYRSVRRLCGLVANDTQLYPTHGFGSFCSSGDAVGGLGSTVGIEKGRNDALIATDEDSFVESLVTRLGAYPSYYAHMAPLNRSGPGPVDYSPVALVDQSELAARLRRGEWVVDLRERRAFAASHLSGSLSFELAASFTTYLGWLIPWGSPLTLLAPTASQVEAAQRQLSRIGIDEIAGAALGPTGDLATDVAERSYRVTTFAELASAGEVNILDVRRDDERASAFIPGSFHLPLQQLRACLEKVPAGEVFVHCASGYRASIAASILDAAGRQVVLVDDDFANAQGVVCAGAAHSTTAA